MGITYRTTAGARSPGGRARRDAGIGDGDTGIGVPLLREGKQGPRELGFAPDRIEAVGPDPPHAGSTGHRGDLGTGGEEGRAGGQHGVADGVLIPRADVEIGAAGAGFGEEHTGADTGATGGEGDSAELGVDDEGAGSVVPVGVGGAVGCGLEVWGGGWWVVGWLGVVGSRGLGLGAVGSRGLGLGAIGARPWAMGRGPWVNSEVSGEGGRSRAWGGGRSWGRRRGGGRDNASSRGYAGRFPFHARGRCAAGAGGRCGGGGHGR